MASQTLQTIRSLNLGGYGVSLTLDTDADVLTFVLTLTVAPGAEPLGLGVLYIDGEPLSVHWKAIGQTYPGTHAGEVGTTFGTDTVTAVFDRRASRLLDKVGDRVLTYQSFSTVPGDDFHTRAVYQEFAWRNRTRAYPTTDQSRFVSCVFKLTKEAFDFGYLTLAEAKRVCNCVESSVFFNPGDAGVPPATFEDWKASWEATYLPRFDWHRANGLRAMGVGDDFLRNPNEQAWLTGTSWALDAVAYVSAKLATYSDVFHCVEMVDEYENIFGSTTAIPDLFVSAWRSVPNYVPLSWPGWYIGNGITDSPVRADCVTRYIYPAGGWAQVGGRYYGDWTLPQIRRMFEGMGGGQTQRMCLCMQVSALELGYVKNVPGGDYVAGVDTPTAEGWRPSTVIPQIAMAAAWGARCYRTYVFDSKEYRDARLATPVGATTGVTGVKPGRPLWEALAQGFAWVKRHEQDLIQGHFRQPSVEGQWVFGRSGNLEFLINTGEEPAYYRGRGRLTSLRVAERSFYGGDVPPGGVLVLQ